jgi:RES domain-containing protein
MASTSDSSTVRVSAWRLVKTAHADHAFDGEGAFRFGGRWNSKGTAMVYASSSLALATMELLVHLDPAMPVPPLLAFRIGLPPELIRDQPAPGGGLSSMDLSTSRQVGDQWIRSRRSVALRVPSVVIPLEHNFLLNPNHPRFPELRIDPPHAFTLDPRLVRWLTGGY